MGTSITGCLIFDSDRDGSSTGLRSAGRGHRTFSWQADHLRVEMQVHEDDLEPGLVQGQVMCTDRGRPIVGARVRLGGGAWAITDGFGQFAMGGPDGPGQRRLLIRTPEGDVRCDVPCLE